MGHHDMERIDGLNVNSEKNDGLRKISSRTLGAVGAVGAANGETSLLPLMGPERL
jgi:hypothetical protein